MSSLVLPRPSCSVLTTRAPAYETAIQGTLSGKEYRQSWASYPRTRYSLQINRLRSDADYREFQALVTWVARHAGQLDSFLLVDPEDCSVTDHGFGVGDGATSSFQLQRTMGGSYSDTLGTYRQSSKPRKNVILRSMEFGNAAWTKRASHVVTTSDAAIAPDGTLSSDLITATFGVAGSGLYQDVASSNGVWTVSIWLKAGTVTSGYVCIKDRATDTVRDSSTVTLTSSWQRLSATGATEGGSAGLRMEFCGIGSGTFYAWGAQAEPRLDEVGGLAGDLAALLGGDIYPAPSQFMPTTSAAVTVTPAYYPAFADGFEPVFEPDPASLLIYKDGVLQVLGTDYTLPGVSSGLPYSGNGIVTFATPPASGVVLSWDGTYYKRVRLDADAVSANRLAQYIWQCRELPLISVKP